MASIGPVTGTPCRCSVDAAAPAATSNSTVVSVSATAATCWRRDAELTGCRDDQLAQRITLHPHPPTSTPRLPVPVRWLRHQGRDDVRARPHHQPCRRRHRHARQFAMALRSMPHSQDAYGTSARHRPGARTTRLTVQALPRSRTTPRRAHMSHTQPGYGVTPITPQAAAYCLAGLDAGAHAQRSKSGPLR
jgi:hypothetical protein